MRIALLLLLILSSCTPQARLNRILKKNPELINSYSVIVHDTIVTQGASTDTIFNYYTKDTVIIREGKLTMKYFYNSHDSTVYLRGECKPDTIYREYVKEVLNVHAKETKFDLFKRFITGNIISLLLLVTVIYMLFKNRR